MQRELRNSEPVIAHCVEGFNLDRCVGLFREATQGQDKPLVNKGERTAESGGLHLLFHFDL